MSSQIQPPLVRKRKRPSNDQAASPSLRSKQHKTGKQDAKSNFYDGLSKVHLTKGALEELHSRSRRSEWPQTPPDYSEPTVEELNGLRNLSRHDGINLSELRGYADKPSKSRHGTQQSQPAQRKARKSSPYDWNFKQHCDDWNIYAFDQGQEPTNQPSIEQDMAAALNTCTRPRNHRAEFSRIVRAIRQAESEEDIYTKVLVPMIDGSGLKLQQDIPFDNLAPLTDVNIQTHTPDAFDGSDPADIDPQVRKALRSYIIPSKDESMSCVPNIIIQVIGPRGHDFTGHLQACWGGALAVRAMDKLHEWTSPGAATEEKASVFSIILDGAAGNGSLKILAHYSVKTDTGPRYMTSLLRSFFLANDEETFYEAKHTIRIVSEIAQRMRGAAVAAANAKVQS